MGRGLFSCHQGTLNAIWGGLVEDPCSVGRGKGGPPPGDPGGREDAGTVTSGDTGVRLASVGVSNKVVGSSGVLVPDIDVLVVNGMVAVMGKLDGVGKVVVGLATGADSVGWTNGVNFFLICP